jgi:hypothetical protein
MIKTRDAGFFLEAFRNSGICLKSKGLDAPRILISGIASAITKSFRGSMPLKLLFTG